MYMYNTVIGYITVNVSYCSSRYIIYYILSVLAVSVYITICIGSIYITNILSILAVHRPFYISYYIVYCTVMYTVMYIYIYTVLRKSFHF